MEKFIFLSMKTFLVFISALFIGTVIFFTTEYIENRNYTNYVDSIPETSFFTSDNKVSLKSEPRKKSITVKEIEPNEELEIVKDTIGWYLVNASEGYAFVDKDFGTTTSKKIISKTNQSKILAGLYAFIGFIVSYGVGNRVRKRFDHIDIRNQGTAREKVQVGIQYFKRDNYEEAIKYFEEAYKSLKKDEQLIYYLALSYFKSAKFHESNRFFFILTRLFPSVSKYHAHLGLSNYLHFEATCEERLFQLSIQSFKRAIELSPSQHEYFNYLEFVKTKLPYSEWQQKLAKFSEQGSVVNEQFENDTEKIENTKIRRGGSPEMTKELSKIPAFTKLEKMTGMKDIKDELEEITAVIKWELSRGSGKKPSGHMVFVGPPGTGKTTVARYLGQILNYIGYLDSGHVVEVKREDLVGEYQGHTAPKTKAKINEAIGGILFIDEAYTLSTDKQDAFGKEAINTLLAEMENRRLEFIVVVAGYPEPMRNFLDSNEGLRSRFSNTINFRDYKPDELIEIFDSLVESENYEIESAARISATIYLKELYANKDKFFGNGRDVRKLFEATVKRMAVRKSREKDKSPLITSGDINEAIEKLKKNIL